MNTSKAIDQPKQIEEFARCVQAGINSWNSAGQILLQLVEADPDVFKKIREKYPYLTISLLDSFLRIGKKQIYAPLLIDSSAAGRALLCLPYALQEKYSTEPIEIAVEWKNGKIKTVKKLISEMTASDVKLVFDNSSLRTLDQQAWRLKDDSSSNTNSDKCDTKTAKCADKTLSKQNSIIDLGYFDITTAHGEVVISKSKEQFAPSVVLLHPSGTGRTATGTVHIKVNKSA